MGELNNNAKAEEPGLKTGDMLVGELRVSDRMMDVIGAFAIIKSNRGYARSLISHLGEAAPNEPLLPYLQMILFFADEFNRTAAKDEKFQEMLDRSERTAAMRNMAF